MKVIPTEHPEVLVLEPRVFEDARGFFFESFSERHMAEAGIHIKFVQDNHSKSQKGTLRGLHYQINHAQTKLCRVIQGTVLDVAVDVRRGSPRFGQWVSVELTAENKRQIFVPQGFAHGFVVLSETAEFLYKCDDFYSPPDERGIAWDDPELNIDWKLKEYGIGEPIMSGKDKVLPALAKVKVEDLPVFGR